MTFRTIDIETPAPKMGFTDTASSPVMGMRSRRRRAALRSRTSGSHIVGFGFGG